MLGSFKDITSRIKTKPTWWDENGTPRYGKFGPMESPDIYATQVLLIKIGCQSCDETFLVEMSYGRYDELYYTYPRGPFDPKKPPPHYGDPPIHGCVGDTENCTDLEVVEFWEKDKKVPWDWTRVDVRGMSDKKNKK